MQQIAYFIEKYKYFLLFVLLEIIAFGFIIQSHSYHKSQFINSANAITGGFLNKTVSFFEYTTLKEENLRLSEENAFLRTKLGLQTAALDTVHLDTNLVKNQYISAKIIANNYTHRNNILTINKGTNDGVHIDMGVINSTGIIGIVNQVSHNYATVLSILNNNTKINARLQKNNYFGTLTWDGKDYKTVQLLDIQRQANIAIGDTIVSGGKSILFPENLPIGIIKSFEASNKNYSNIEISLFTDMSNLGYVHVIDNLDKEEILELHEND
ncbi:rod shape-determining protein MreC [Flavicella marina]|uniref:rod shape-determining protein MreC n=1 Tax=Flavicella marina TaxID=1475951 RepID=UPI0012645151|nr:rod shape-determining protein MreC [Flavicella marina]